MGSRYASRHSALQYVSREPIEAKRSTASTDADSRVQTTLTLTAAFGISLAAFAVGRVLDVEALSLAGALGSLLLGVGTAPVQNSSYSLSARLGVAGLVGPAVLILVGSTMALASAWHPVFAAGVVVAVALVVHVHACVKAMRWARRNPGGFSRGRSSWRVVNPSTVFTCAGTSAWLWAAFERGHVVPGIGGFLTQISPFWFLGLALLVIAVVTSRGESELSMALAVTSLAAALTVTPALVYGTPPQAAAKHVDLVQQLLLRHAFDRSASIYEAYSGFFSAVAWLCRLCDVRDYLELAAFWPFVIELICLIEMRYFLARLRVASKFRLWLATGVAVLVISVGDLYFSPQSVGFVIGLGIYALVLAHGADEIRSGMMVLVLTLAGCALAVTHELSPFIAGGVLIVLVLFRVIKQWYAPAAVLAPAIIWAAVNWHDVSYFVTFRSLGDISNFAPPATVASPGLHRVTMVGYSSDALLFGLLVLIVLALKGFWRSWRADTHVEFLTARESWAFLVSAGVGLVLIAFNPYGNEGIFRAALFGVPWLAMLAAISFDKFYARWMAPAAGVTLSCLLAAQVVSDFALDNANVIRIGDFRAYSKYMAMSTSDSFMLDLSYGPLPYSATFPSASHTFSHLVDWPTVVPRFTLGDKSLTADALVALDRQYLRLAKKGGDRSGTQLYAIWSPASAAYAVDYGLETRSMALAWRFLLIKSSQWRLVYADEGTYLFELKPSGGSS